MKTRTERNDDGSYVIYSVETDGIVAIGTGVTEQEAREDFENSLKELAEDMTDEEKARLITKPEYR